MTTLSIRSPLRNRASSLRPNEAGYPLARARMTQLGILNGLTYLFPYAPVAVTYDAVGSEYQEVQRPGKYALISQRAPNLLKASFEFRVAHRPTNGLQPISRDLDLLRKMSVEDIPVIITGVGGFFTGYGTNSSTRFRIVNLNVEIVTLSPENEPWQANMSIELMEDRNPLFTTVEFAAISYADVPATKSTGNRGATAAELSALKKEYSKVPLTNSRYTRNPV